MTATAYGWWPGQIRRGDPSRRHLHDYFLIDGETLRDVAGFATQEAALLYATRLGMPRGRLLIFQVVHPSGCGCAEAPPVDSTGRAAPGAADDPPRRSVPH
jgi:hypothetical protein